MVLKSMKSCALRCEVLDVIYHIKKRLFVKIYMQMMDFEYSKNAFFLS